MQNRFHCRGRGRAPKQSPDLLRVSWGRQHPSIEDVAGGWEAAGGGELVEEEPPSPPVSGLKGQRKIFFHDRRRRAQEKFPPENRTENLWAGSHIGRGGGGGAKVNAVWTLNVLTTTTRRRWSNRNGGVQTAAWRTFRRRSTLHRAVKNNRVTVQGPVKKPQMDLFDRSERWGRARSDEGTCSCAPEVPVPKGREG